MKMLAYLRRLVTREADPALHGGAAYIRRLDELRHVLAFELSEHRIERGHA